MKSNWWNTRIGKSYCTPSLLVQLPVNLVLTIIGFYAGIRVGQVYPLIGVPLLVGMHVMLFKWLIDVQEWERRERQRDMEEANRR